MGEWVEGRQVGLEAGTARIEAGPLFSSGCPMGQVVKLRRLIRLHHIFCDLIVRGPGGGREGPQGGGRRAGGGTQATLSSLLS